MSKAFKCDRCGKFYGKYKLDQQYQFKGMAISVCHMLGNGEAQDVLDLCEACRTQLVIFMQNLYNGSVGKGFVEKVNEGEQEKALWVNIDILRTCERCRHSDGNKCMVQIKNGFCSPVTHDAFEPKED